MLGIGQFAIIQIGIVEPPVRLQGDVEFPLLVGVREQAELECLPHGLFPPLFGDIPLDGRGRHVAYAPREVAPGPQRGEPGSERREPFPQRTGCRSLEAVDDLGHAPRRIALDEQVHVIRHHFEGVDRHPQFGRLIGEQGAELISDITDQDRAPILGAPDQVVLQREDGARVLCVTTVHATDYTDVGQPFNTFVHRAEGGDSPLP